MGVFALLCPPGERLYGAVFQVVLLLLVSEAWHFLWFVPSAFLTLKSEKSRKDAARADSGAKWIAIAKWTSPVVLVLPPLLYGIIALADTLFLSGQLAEACGFAHWGSIFKASYASAVGLFAATLLFPVIPFSFTNFWEYYNWDSPLSADRGMVDVSQPASADAEAPCTTHDGLSQHHSAYYEQNLARLRSLLQEGEELVYATAPQVELLWRRPGKGAVSTAVCLVTLVVGLVGLVGVTQVADSSMRLFCGGIAFFGLVMGAWSYRAIRTEKKRLTTCDYFLTSERFCRLNSVDKPKNIFWKDKPKLSLSRIPGSDIGNIHISPTTGIFSSVLTKLAGEPEVQKSQSHDDLDGMECVHDCQQIFNLANELLAQR